jgi:hypothetical protein
MIKESFETKKYLLIPIIKNPYSRIGPEKWQDWYRQIERTVEIARKIKNQGDDATLILLSNFQPKGRSSEIEIYEEAIKKLAPEIKVISYRETNCTAEQIEKSFKLQKEVGAKLIFISAWMQYPRVLYLAHDRIALHYGAFGIPHPVFTIIDLACIVLEPLANMFGIANFFQKIIVRQREKGRIL